MPVFKTKGLLKQFDIGISFLQLNCTSLRDLYLILTIPEKTLAEPANPRQPEEIVSFPTYCVTPLSN